MSVAEHRDTDWGALTGRLREAIGTISSLLKNEDHSRAYAALKQDGELNPDADEARAIWEETLARKPGDPISLHHLAIIHHARAFDLEERGDEDAFDEWSESLTCWHALLANRAYWAEWIARGRSASDRFQAAEFEAFLSRVPHQLLSIHQELARRHLHGDPGRAQRHIETIVASPFRDAIKGELRRGLYVQMVQGADMDLSHKKFDQAMDKIARYLAIDPEYPLALEELVNAFNGHIGLLRDKRQFDEIDRLVVRHRQSTLRLEGLAEKGDPNAAEAMAEFCYQDGLVALNRPNDLSEAKQRNEQVREWHVESAIRATRRAISQFERSRKHDSGRRVLQGENVLAVTWCNLAAHHATVFLVDPPGLEAAEEAVRCADAALRIDDERAYALIVKAFAFARLKRLDRAYEMLTRAREIAARKGDARLLSECESARPQLLRISLSF